MYFLHFLLKFSSPWNYFFPSGKPAGFGSVSLGWEITHGFCLFLDLDSPAAITSAASPPCQGPFSQLPLLGKRELAALALSGPALKALPGNGERGMRDVEIAPKYPGSAPQDCSADIPSPCSPAWFSVSPPCTKAFGGCCVAPFPFPFIHFQDLVGEKRRFWENSVGAQGRKGGAAAPIGGIQGSPHLHPFPNYSLQLLLGKRPAPTPPGAPRTPGWVLPGISPPLVPHHPPGPCSPRR